MLTPFDVEDAGKKILSLRTRVDTFSQLKARAAWEKLLITVLEEIARGSIDPKSLATEALKYRKELSRD